MIKGSDSISDQRVRLDLTAAEKHGNKNETIWRKTFSS